jgi:hypothetical protein
VAGLELGHHAADLLPAGKRPGAIDQAVEGGPDAGELQEFATRAREGEGPIWRGRFVRIQTLEGLAEAMSVPQIRPGGDRVLNKSSEFHRVEFKTD